jgi:hypothetical protein
VSGVSWYEAAAYAAWAGKTLPTIFHWNRVAMTFSSALIAPLANLSGRGTVAVGSAQRLGVPVITIRLRGTRSVLDLAAIDDDANPIRLPHFLHGAW